MKLLMLALAAVCAVAGCATAPPQTRNQPAVVFAVTTCKGDIAFFVGVDDHGRYAIAGGDSKPSPYDTMLVGHWHQHMQLRRFIVNGSLKGYDEYAYVNNFPFEPPAQAFWITHPQVGKTFSMPVYAERPQRAAAESWAAWQTPAAA